MAYRRTAAGLGPSEDGLVVNRCGVESAREREWLQDPGWASVRTTLQVDVPHI